MNELLDEVDFLYVDKHQDFSQGNTTIPGGAFRHAQTVNAI